MELYSTDLAGDELKKINEDSKITVDELKKLNELRLGELSANSVKERTLGVPVKPAEGASYEAQKDYEMAQKSYDSKVAILDKFDTGIAKLKESHAASREALFKDSKDELAKLEAAIGIAKPAAAEAGTTTPGTTPAKVEGKTDVAPAVKPEPAKAETVVPAAAPAEQKEAPKTAEYVVKSGDNLTKIAKAHGTTVEAMVKENNIANADKIRVGQKLKFPAKAESKAATDTEAAAATAKPDAKKDAKAGEEKAADAKTDKKPGTADKKVADADKKPEAKAGEVPPATATVADKAKIEATAKPEPTKVAYADVQTPIGGSGTNGNPFPKK